MSKNLLLIIFVLIIFPGYSNIIAVTEDVSLSATVLGCGNDTIDGSEQCDGVDLGGASCVSQGFASGTLSCSVSCTFNTSSCISTPIVQSGGSSGSYPAFNYTSIIFSGYTLPYNKVFILKDGQLIATTMSDSFGHFSSTINGFSSGLYNFSIYAENKENMRSGLTTFPVYITARTTNNINNIFIKQDAFVFDAKGSKFLKTDLNHDWHINFLDFSILHYWYDKIFPPNSMDLNTDGKIDLVDFSIMAYYWTG